MSARRLLEVPVSGGTLTVALSGPDPALAEQVIVFVHGITANHKAWALVTPRLNHNSTALAVDLRGRGGSVDLSSPWGMAAHANDLATLLNYVGVDECFIVGHSMGGFVATAFGQRFPDRLRGAVLVDGGVAMSLPPDTPPQGVVEAVIGPAMTRLRRTFRSRDDYRKFWASHPAFSAEGVWNDAIADYCDYDLGGIEPSLASRVNEAAVRHDGAEVLLDEQVIEAVNYLDCPVELIRVERGILNEPIPLIDSAVAVNAAAANPQVRVTNVAALNHYSITLTPAGADVVAAAIRRVVRRAEAESSVGLG